MVNPSRILHQLSIVILVAGVAYPLQANTAYSFQTASVSSDTSLSIGVEFKTLEPVAVYALGYYDDGLDGFLAPHEIGIFDSSGVLLTATFLGSGTTVPLVGQFRYQNIAPLELPAGEIYTVAATSGGPDDPWAYGVAGDTITGFVTDPAIQILSDAARFVYQSDDVLQYPCDQYGGYTIYGGPNFLLSVGSEAGVQATPEPGTHILVGVTLMAIFLPYMRRRRRCRS